MNYLFAKRFLDILGSVLGLFILSPLFLLIAIWVSFESSGGPFYKQIRVGRNGKYFRLFKFRSMRLNSDQLGKLTIGKDPRITKSGAFIRKYKLDELPQLINVLLGQMSLVGPRPELPYYVSLYDKQHQEVLKVKPGITDWASIKYFEENKLLAESADPEYTYIHKIMPDKLLLNLEYISKCSLKLDFQIIWKTIARILKKN